MDGHDRNISRRTAGQSYSPPVGRHRPDWAEYYLSQGLDRSLREPGCHPAATELAKSELVPPIRAAQSKLGCARELTVRSRRSMTPQN